MNRLQDRLLLAIGWVWLITILVKELAVSDLATILGVLAASEVLARILTAGWEHTFDPVQEPQNWPIALPRFLIRWTAFCSIYLVFAHIFSFQTTGLHPHSILYVVGVTLCLGILRLGDTCIIEASRSSFIFRPYPFRMLFLAIISYLVVVFNQNSSGLILMLVILINGALMLGSLANFNRAWHEQEVYQGRFSAVGNSMKAALPLVASNIDILILPFVLKPSGTVIYLLARGLAHLMQMVLDHLEWKLSRALFDAYRIRSKDMFRKVSARANLAVLLIGCAAAFVVLACAKYLEFVGVISSENYYQTLFWVALGASARCIFGATSVLLEVTSQRREGACLSGISILAFFSVIKTGQISTAQDLAWMYAVTQLLHFGMVAALLAVRSQVWPGFTALLCYQIRLR